MKKNKMLRYFNNYIPYLIAGIITAIAGYLLWWYSWELWRLGTPLMLIGAALIVAFFSLRVTDNDYKEYIKIKLSKMPADPEHKPDYIFDGYSLDQNHFIKTDKDGHVCTETAFSTHIYLGKKLRVVIGTANVETDDVQYNEYEFSSVCAEIENFEAQVYKNVKKLARMKLSWDGTECTFPVRHNDIDVDQLCEKLKEKYS